jgi:hypothetical protein
MSPPTKPLSVTHGSAGPRAPPYGVCRRTEAFWVAAFTEICWVPW